MKNKKPKKKQITEDTNISEVLQINRNAAQILEELGLGCIGCVAAQFETLEQGLKAHGFNSKEINEIIEKLNKK